MADKKEKVVLPPVEDDEPVYDADYFAEMQKHLAEEEGLDDE